MTTAKLQRTAAKQAAARRALDTAIREARAQGMSLREIAAAVGVSHETIRKVVG